MPSLLEGGVVPTLNRMGYMSVRLDAFSLEFVGFAASATRPVLDVGAAYGSATLAALAAGATVIANDIDARHLEILERRVPAAHRARLRTIVGAFPGGIGLPRGSLQAALLCRVLHFLPGRRIESGLRRLHGWLVPGGRIYAVCQTPYAAPFRAYLAEYSRRRARGLRWPGWVADIGRRLPRYRDMLPHDMHLLDIEVLRRCLSETGFTIRRAEYFRPPELPEMMWLDGREAVGVSAERSA
jgi:hypothetical protein